MDMESFNSDSFVLAWDLSASGTGFENRAVTAANRSGDLSCEVVFSENVPCAMTLWALSVSEGLLSIDPQGRTSYNTR